MNDEKKPYKPSNIGTLYRDVRKAQEEVRRFQAAAQDAEWKLVKELIDTKSCDLLKPDYPHIQNYLRNTGE